MTAPPFGSPLLRTRRSPIWSLLALLAALALVWGAGLLLFIANLDRVAASTEGERTDAIVVLTGGRDRLAAGLSLLAEDRAEKLFISGVYRGVDVQELLRISQQVPAELACCIVLGHDAEDTEGNAMETARWVRAEGFGSLRLVTANYHMPRSLVEFRRVLPDVHIVPHPVAPANVRLDQWYLRRGTAELMVGEYTKYLLASLRAILLGPRKVPAAAPEEEPAARGPAGPEQPAPVTG